MKRLAIAGMCLTIGLLMTNCSANTETGQESTTPTPEPTLPTLSASPAPPVWNQNEQAAIDAVQAYLDTWTRISQNITTANWSDLNQVATDQAYDDSLKVWSQWQQLGVHLVGEPEYTVNEVTPAVGDDRGSVYLITGCYDLTNGFLANEAGVQTGTKKADRALIRYSVLTMSPDTQVVVMDETLEQTC